MPIQETHGLAGRLTIELRDPHGTLVDRRTVRNLITRDGRQLLADLFTGTVQTPQLQIAVGAGDTPASFTDAALHAPLDAAPATVPGVRVEDYENAPRAIVKVVATLPPTGNAEAQPLQEAGIVATLPGRPPVLYNRVVFPLVNRAGNLEMTLTWEVIF